MEFSYLISQIKETNKRFQQHSVKSVDKFLTIRNWIIGGYIVEYEQKGTQKARYGSKLELTLSKKINQKGFSARNLKLFKQFYNTYPQIQQILPSLPELPPQMVHTLSASFEKPKKASKIKGNDALKLIDNLSFSHFVELLKISETQKRLFYEIQIIQSTLSIRELKRQINTLTYERTYASENKNHVLKQIQNNLDVQKPSDILKTSYVFDFLELPDSILASESDLENALITNLKNFMLELGHGFCFEAQQKRIIIGGEYYFIDLVFYHRILKCHVLIELKVDTFKHEHAGQLNTYLQYFKKNIKETNDNPPIGILLCTNQNTELVKYALGGMDENLFVSEYKTILPSQEELTAFLQTEKQKLS